MLLITDIFLSLFGLIILILGSIQDIRERELYDVIAYLSIVIPIIARLFYSLITSDWHYTVYSLIPFILALCFGLLMYYSNQWGGGDVKLLFGLSLILGTWPIFAIGPLSQKLASVINPPLLSSSFFIIFLFISMICGAIIGLSYGIYSLIKEYKRSKKEINSIVRKHRIENIIMLSSQLILVLLSIIFQNIILLICALTILSFQVLIIFTLAIEKIMIKEITPIELTEGDWVINDIIIDNKKIYDHNQPGIELSQIRKLIKLYHDKKINKVKIKVGFPFIPSFLIAYITTFIIFIFF